MNEYKSKKGGVLIGIFAVLLVLICAAGVYFYIDKTFTDDEIAAIDNASYSSSSYEKGAQHEPQGIPLSADTSESLSNNIYKTPLGFSIISYSKKWTDEKLVDIYNELISNTHGDEIMYVSEVEVYPGNSDMDTSDTMVAGAQSSKDEVYPVFIDLPAFVPQTLRYNLESTVSIIELYNMDQYNSASEAARTIAHEYGHHFTMYYFLKDDDTALSSEYYMIRDFAGMGHKVFYNDWEEYLQNHEWDIYEIAAEDYVQIMGGPNTRQTQKFIDIKGILAAGKDKNPDLKDDASNIFPQENIYIPMADEVAGLRDYFYSFIGKENDYTPLLTTDFKLKKVKHTTNHNSVYYEITWTKTSVDKNALYTLVCYDKNGDFLRPVKTVYGNEKAVAYVGVVDNGSVQWTDHITDKDRIFKLYLILPDGRMQASEPFIVNF